MQTNNKSWQEMNDIIRVQKHWLLNQFQVVMGYLQLGKKDIAVDFIKRATSEIEGTTIFTRMEDAHVGVRACLLWWKMKDGNISLFPIIDKSLKIKNIDDVFDELTEFLDYLKEKHYEVMADKHITWKLKTEGEKFISELKFEEDFELPRIEVENTAILEKLTVEGNSIIYTIQA